MEVLLMVVDIHILNAGSLKEKRRILNSIKDNLRNKFNISISEIDYHDLWQRSNIGLVRINRNNTTQPFDRMLNYLRSIILAAYGYTTLKLQVLPLLLGY